VINGKKAGALKYLEPLYLPKDIKRAIIVFPFAAGGPEVFGNLTNSIKNTTSDTAVYFVRYLHSFEDCENAAKEIKNNLSGIETTVYSHCVGSAIALQVISSLESDGFSVNNFFAAAFIPPAKPIKRNLWNICPDSYIKNRLSNAGAMFNQLSKEVIKKFLRDFRKDTSFANLSFYKGCPKIKTPVIVILTKKDPFTKNYKNSEKIWKLYVDNIEKIQFIDSNTHYFQTTNHKEIAELIVS
jgi:surfactin synthase thioesterase subunit